MSVSEEITFNDPNNMCFGCSQHNSRGLQMKMFHVGDGLVESTIVAPDHTCGAPGVIHGGIQATMLDEACGFAVHAYAMHHGEGSADDPEWQRIVTMEFSLRYRRPAPVGPPLTLRARVTDVQGDDFHLTAELLNGDELCTTATAKWRRLKQ